MAVVPTNPTFGDRGAEAARAPWDASLDRSCGALAAEVCDPARAPRDRDAAWKRLLVALAPHVESWARKNRVLRRAGLASEDDARAVLVSVFARLGRNDFENLRRWLARRPPAAEDEGETDVVERLVRLAQNEPPSCAPREGESELREPRAEDTPLRGWLLNLLRFVVKDHVKQRLGWEALPETGTRAPGDKRDKRDVGTNADRLDDVAEQGARPPLTDMVALRRLLGEMKAYVATFPAPMREALDMWMQDASFEEIAAHLGLDGPEAARKLARAAQARLRERFHDAMPDLSRVGS